MRRVILLGALGVAILALAVGTALATPPLDQTVTPVTKATLGTFDAEGAGIEVESEQCRQTLRLQRLSSIPEALLAGTIFPVSLWLRLPPVVWLYMTKNVRERLQGGRGVH